ncbi:MAG: ABC transporter permease [Armatimonadetes bacterium]|nr:ABC transporter permease [Armatimonadota bacterium]
MGKCWAIAKKDIRIYYLKGPVLIFGLLFPAFLFLAFAIGRNVPPANLVPGLIGMALFFTASATGPAILPFETRTRTLERLLVAPLSMSMLIGGDVLAALLFGLAVSFPAAVICIVVLSVTVVSPVTVITSFLLSALCYALLGTLLSVPATDQPHAIMTLSNLVRLPLIFFSGVFIPVSQMPQWGQWLSFISPLTYTTELLRAGLGQEVVVGSWWCVVALVAFSAVFWVVAMALHRRNMPKRLAL